MIFVGIFGLFHGIAHGIEVPAAANPILFVLGFIFGTTTLHLLGVVIGHFHIRRDSHLAKPGREGRIPRRQPGRQLRGQCHQNENRQKGF